MLVRLADLTTIDAALDDRVALRRALGCEVAQGWTVFPSGEIADADDGRARRFRLDRTRE